VSDALTDCFQIFGRRIALLEHHGFPEESIRLVQTLDIDGMSSEESDGEIGTRRTYRIKQLPWRSKIMTNWLHRIDELPTKNRQNAIIRRMDHRKRVHSDAVSETRTPICGLPINLYSSTWYKSRNERFIKKLSVKQAEFLLPKVDEYLPNRH
jgi:hypothetical protein